MKRYYRRHIAMLSVFFLGCALKRHSIPKLKEVGESYRYQEQPTAIPFYPLLAYKAEQSTDYDKAFEILSRKATLSQEHFVALQAFRDSYRIHSKKTENKHSEKFCIKLYSVIRSVFLDTKHDYRLRLKALEYMNSFNRRGFPDSEIAEAVEVIATAFGNDKNTKDARKRAVLFIKKHNIM